MKEVTQLRRVVIKPGLFPVSIGKVAYFHKWCEEPFYSYDGRYISKTLGLVEGQDGKIYFIDPEIIQFENQEEK
jgi:hypothetical protein